MHFQQTPMLEMAARFVNSTSSHLFLTGKAGTGKTTFLRQLAGETHKSFLILAPTGIAALNAGGVTIHSQFLLPFGSFLPEREAAGTFSESIKLYTKHTLSRIHTLNSRRKKVLRATELLIIDEVSMLRADILDAIDFRMRSAKGNYTRSFGGTQLLLIGDLHQLPPIVKEDEWQLLQKYYRSMHFFEALAFRKDKPVTIALDKIFRQSDETFIRILNHLRDNIATKEDLAILHSHYRSEEQTGSEGQANKQEQIDQEEIITITTHNHIADGINRKKMDALPGPPSFFEADIQGDFPEKLYPIARQIELKAGARVMFIKNDSSEEKAYVNGKLARIDRIMEDEIVVIMSGSEEEYTLRKERWENKRYTVNEESKEVEEEVTGNFEQYPVKPAWAVTVHKSQGLTFEKAIIDVGKAFAPGQVYVALSRLQSLEGLILRTPINTSSILNDQDVLSFSATMEEQGPLSGLLQEKQRGYLEEVLSSTFDFSRLTKLLEDLQYIKAENKAAIGILLKRFSKEKENTGTFRAQLQRLLQQNRRDLLLERVSRGSEYYSLFMKENLKLLLFHLAEVLHQSRTKTYRNALSEIDQQMMLVLERLEQAEGICRSIIEDRPIDKRAAEQRASVSLRSELWEMAEKAIEESSVFHTGKPGRKPKKGAKSGKGARSEKGETNRITYALVKEGKTIREIADKRDLAASTIEGHAVKGIASGDLELSEVLPKKIADEVSRLMKKEPGSLSELYKAQNGKYSYAVLRMVQAHRQRKAQHDAS